MGEEDANKHQKAEVKQQSTSKSGTEDKSTIETATPTSKAPAMSAKEKLKAVKSKKGPQIDCPKCGHDVSMVCVILLACVVW